MSKVKIALNDLPDELILLVVEVGQFKTKDALALRWTSHKLFASSQLHSFWICVAINIQNELGDYLPLPLPLFCPGLNCVPVDELMASCIIHRRTLLNLASSNPSAYKHRVVDLPHGGEIIGVEVLPGGRFALIIFRTREIQVWDVNEGPGPCDMDGNVFKVGKHVASYTFSGRLQMYEYQVCSGDNEVQIATLSRDSTDSSKFSCLMATFHWAESEVRVVQDRTFEIPFVVQNPSPRIIQRDDLIAVLYEEDELIIFLLNTRTGRNVVLHTQVQIDAESTIQFDMVLTDSHDLILCAAEGFKMTLYAYFDILQLLDAGSDHPRAIDKIPDGSRTITYKQDDYPLEDSFWETNLRWQTHHVGQRRPWIVVATTSYIGGAEDRHPRTPVRYTLHRLNVDDEIRPLKFPESSSSPAQVSRRHLCIFWSSSIGPEQEVLSSTGHRVLWIDASDDDLSVPKLHFSALATATEADDDQRRGEGYLESELQGTIDIPVNLREVIGIDFCDEAAVMSVITEESDTAGKQVHLFDF